MKHDPENYAARHSDVDQGKADFHRSGLDKTAMGTGVRFACITHGGPLPRGSARDPNQPRPSRWREENANPAGHV